MVSGVFYCLFQSRLQPKPKGLALQAATRQCPEQGVTKEKMALLVGEEDTQKALQPGLKPSYAAVLKDPTFLTRQRVLKEHNRRHSRAKRVGSGGPKSIAIKKQTEAYNI